MEAMRSTGTLLFGLVAVLWLGTAGAAPPAAPEPTQPEPGAKQPGGPAGLDESAVDLETALQWTLSGNPDLVAVRQDLGVSAAALAVARKFPMSLNPAVSVDVRPWTFERNTGQGARALGTQVSVSWLQPIELGHRTRRRTAIAQAAYNQTEWNILQAELTALVQTYRVHQTAAYRREKLRVAQQLADFNARLLETVRRQVDAGRILASDMVLAEVEHQSTIQQLHTAQQEYVEALTQLRKQIGLPQYAASAHPAGRLRVPDSAIPLDEESLTRVTLESHPEIQVARARVSASHAAMRLARADRIPIPSVGPVYEIDESGTTFYGLAVSGPIPVLNSGKTIVHKREAEHSRDLVALEQLEVKTVARVKATRVKWKQVTELASRINASAAAIQAQTDRMERLYQADQTDLVKLLQVRRRLIEVENAQLDMSWQATQAYADLLDATGATPLLGSLSERPGEAEISNGPGN